MTTSASKAGGPPRQSAEWIGSLAHTPLASVLRRIALEERSGDLQVTSPTAIKTVYFDRGFIVFASSNLKKDRLGESMIEAGRISRHEFALASMLMKSRKEKLGRVLVSAGILSEEELGHHVAAQVNQIVLSLFSAKRGMYSFDERPCSIPVDLMVSLSVYRISIEGVRRMTSKRLVLVGLPPLDTRVRVVELPPFTLDVDKLRPLEKQVLRAAGTGSGTSLREIVEGLDENDGVVLRACYGLLSGGALEAVVPDERRQRLRVQEETGTFVLSEIRSKAGDPERPMPPAAPPAQPEPELDAAPEPARLTDAPAPSTPPSEALEGGRPAPVSIPGPSEPTPDRWSSVLRWLAGVWTALASAWRERFARAPDAIELPPPPRETEVPSAPAPASLDTAEAPAEPAPPLPSPRTETETAEPTAPPATPIVERLSVPPWSIADDPSQAPISSTEADVDADAGGDPARALVVERLGVPSWSMLDDPNEADAYPEDDPQTLIRSLGVPSWSMKDDPTEASPPASFALHDDREDAPATDGSHYDGVAFVPSWSLMDPPNQPVRPGLGELAEPDVAGDAGAESEAEIPNRDGDEKEAEHLGTLDSELFIPDDVSEPTSSLMTSIPLESVEVEVESEPGVEDEAKVGPQVEVESHEAEDESEFEVEIEEEAEVEVEEEARADVEVAAEAEAGVEVAEEAEAEAEVDIGVEESTEVARASEPEPAADPRREPERPVAAELPSRPHPDETPPIEPPLRQPVSASAASEPQTPDREAREQAMRRMRQSGGEARLFRDVKLHFRMRDWGGAVSLLEQLVDISPGSALYRGLMARAMSRHPRLRKDAEGQFIAALRLAPQDPQLHYWLGQYYESFGLKSRAVTEFRTTLRINPRHEGALKHLGGARKEDALGGVFKKLLG